FPLRVMVYLVSLVLTSFWLGTFPALLVSVPPPAYLMTRALSCRLILGPETVRIRNLLRTEEVPVSAVRGLRVGKFLRWTTVPGLAVLVVQANGGDRRIPVHATISFDPDESVRSLERMLSSHSN